MRHHAERFTVRTTEVREIVARSQILCGPCNVFVHPTSASLILCENRLVPDGDPLFEHPLTVSVVGS